MVRQVLTGPEIWVGPRRYRFIGAIDRVPGPIDVVYFGTDQDVWEYALVREGELLQVIPFASVEAVLMVREMNVRLSPDGWLSFESAATGERVVKRVGEVTEREWKAMGRWVRPSAAEDPPGPAGGWLSFGEVSARWAKLGHDVPPLPHGGVKIG